jgi:hypothetical protein
MTIRHYASCRTVATGHVADELVGPAGPPALGVEFTAIENRETAGVESHQRSSPQGSACDGFETEGSTR